MKKIILVDADYVNYGTDGYDEGGKIELQTSEISLKDLIKDAIKDVQDYEVDLATMMSELLSDKVVKEVLTTYMKSQGYVHKSEIDKKKYNYANSYAIIENYYRISEFDELTIANLTKAYKCGNLYQKIDFESLKNDENGLNLWNAVKKKLEQDKKKAETLAVNKEENKKKRALNKIKRIAKELNLDVSQLEALKKK